MTPVRLEPATLRSRVKHSTTEPLRSPEIEVTVHLLMSITVIWQPPDVKIKIMNTAIINLEDEGMIYEK